MSPREKNLLRPGILRFPPPSWRITKALHMWPQGTVEKRLRFLTTSIAPRHPLLGAIPCAPLTSSRMDIPEIALLRSERCDGFIHLSERLAALGADRHFFPPRQSRGRSLPRTATSSPAPYRSPGITLDGLPPSPLLASKQKLASKSIYSRIHRAAGGNCSTDDPDGLGLRNTTC